MKLEFTITSVSFAFQWINTKCGVPSTVHRWIKVWNNDLCNLELLLVRVEWNKMCTAFHTADDNRGHTWKIFLNDNQQRTIKRHLCVNGPRVSYASAIIWWNWIQLTSPHRSNCWLDLITVHEKNHSRPTMKKPLERANVSCNMWITRFLFTDERC